MKFGLIINKINIQKIHKATVRPIMPYTLETRAETSRTRQMLEANKVKVLTKLLAKQNR